MSEQNAELELSVENNVARTTTLPTAIETVPGVKPDPQLAKAKEIDLAWKFEDKEYGLFVANRTGNVGSPILNPATGKQMAILSAEFAWDDGRPFLDHLNLNIRDERSSRDDESVRKRANIVSQNARLFRDLVQRGSLIKIDAYGEHSDLIPKTRDELLAYPPEIQSQMIDDWLGNFHIERFFPIGSDDIDAMLSNSETVFFTAKIGNYKSPAHVLLFEFTTPSPDARRNYENDSFSPGSKQDGDRMVNTYHVNHNTKLQFARRYFKSVSGAILSKTNDVEINTDSLYRFQEGNIEQVNAFKEQFNPHWWIRLADQLADSFNFAGK